MAEMEKKENRRSAYSRKVIKESFIELLARKPLSKIGVKEICEKADVNRCTFYAYYKDIYDLHDKIMDEFLEKQREIGVASRESLKLKSRAGQSITDDDVYLFMKRVLELVVDNIEIAKIIYNPDSQNKIHLEIGQMFFDMLIPFGFPTHSKLKVEWLKSTYTFVTGGVTGSIYLWMIRGFPQSIDKMALSLARNIYNVLINPRIGFEG